MYGFYIFDQKCYIVDFDETRVIFSFSDIFILFLHNFINIICIPDDFMHFWSNIMYSILEKMHFYFYMCQRFVEFLGQKWADLGPKRVR